MEKRPPTTIDEYIARQPRKIQIILRKMRTVIRKAAPGAVETISYQIPTFKLDRNLVHFAAFSNHISFFPASSGVRVFEKELAKYKTSKGTIQFPLETPIPYGLIARITKFRVKETLAQQKAKK